MYSVQTGHSSSTRRLTEMSSSDVFSRRTDVLAAISEGICQRIKETLTKLKTYVGTKLKDVRFETVFNGSCVNLLNDQIAVGIN